MKNVIVTIFSVVLAIVAAVVAVKVISSSYKIDTLEDAQKLISGASGYFTALIAVGVFAVSTFVPLLVSKLISDNRLRMLVLAAVLVINAFISFTWITASQNELTGGFGRKLGTGAIIGTVIGLLISIKFGGIFYKHKSPELEESDLKTK